MEERLLIEDGLKNMGAPRIKSVSIRGQIIDGFQVIKMKHIFVNNAQNGEIIYNFPMPKKASIAGFSARIGEKTITSSIMETTDGEERYRTALKNGNTGMLMKTTASEVFTLSLGQLAKEEEVEVNLTYMLEQESSKGRCRVAIPMVLAPKYIPEYINEEEVQCTVNLDENKNAVELVFSEDTYPVRINIEVLQTKAIKEIVSSSHELLVEYYSDNKAKVDYSSEKGKMDSDFVLNISSMGRQEDHILIEKGPAENEWNYGRLVVTPELPEPRKEERDYVFLLDISGSMGGIKLIEAKKALQLCLRNLSEGDRFSMAAFESELHYFQKELLVYNSRNLSIASSWVNRLTSMGGTEMIPAVEFAIKEKTERERVVILITDGQVSNESELVRYVRDRNENLNFYGIGIDTSVNAGFLQDISTAGNGFCELIYPGENIDEKVIRHFTRINSSWLEHIEIEPIDATVGGYEFAADMPKRGFDMEPMSVFFRMKGTVASMLKLTGTNKDGIAMEFDVGKIIDVGRDEAGGLEHLFILEKLWGKDRILSLEKEIANFKSNTDKWLLNTELVKVSQEFGILSNRTSFFAEYERVSRVNGEVETFVIPVSKPRDWEIPGYGGVILNNTLHGILAKCFLAVGAMDFNATSTVRNREFSNSEKQELSVGILDIAMKQDADGSFAPEDYLSDEAEKPKLRVLKTMEFIKAVIEEDSDMNMLRRQMEKALEFLFANIDSIKENGLLPEYENLVEILIKTKKLKRSFFERWN